MATAAAVPAVDRRRIVNSDMRSFGNFERNAGHEDSGKAASFREPEWNN